MSVPIGTIVRAYGDACFELGCHEQAKPDRTLEQTKAAYLEAKAAIVAAVARLKEDAECGVVDRERLDWLAANDAHITGGTGQGTVGVCWWPDEKTQRCIGGETVREAIDKARSLCSCLAPKSGGENG